MQRIWLKFGRDFNFYTWRASKHWGKNFRYQHFFYIKKKFNTKNKHLHCSLRSLHSPVPHTPLSVPLFLTTLSRSSLSLISLTPTTLLSRSSLLHRSESPKIDWGNNLGKTLKLIGVLIDWVRASVRGIVLIILRLCSIIYLYV